MAETVTTIEFTAQECAVARELLNVALKAGGRNVVHPFAVIDGKFAQAIEAKVKKEREALEEASPAE